MNTHKKVNFALLSILAVITTTWCADAIPTSNSKTGQQPFGKLGSTSKGRNSTKTTPKKSPYITKELGDLTPLPSGAGVLFGEPVVLPNQSKDNDLGDFGAACSRWLQFYVGGQIAIGKTPLWASVEATRREMRKPNLRLAKSDIPQVTRALGLTHVAIGKIRPLDNSDHYSLEFQLFDTTPAKLAVPVKTLNLKGTKAEILAQLPKQAALLCAILGAKSPNLPGKIEVQPDEMHLLGKGGWTFAQSLTNDELKQLREVAAREPLAALLSLEYEARTDVKTEWQYNIVRDRYYSTTFYDSNLVRNLVDTLLTKTGKNPLALAEIFSINVQQALPYSALLHPFIQNNQNNYALQCVDTSWFIHGQDIFGSTQVARKAVRCAPRNPYAWITLAKCIYDEADSVRRGRFTNDISEKDWEFINPRYLQNYIVAKKAAALDPENPAAWHEVTTAALLAGDAQLADNAFWKTHKLEPDNVSYLEWGLDMYQPKWMSGKADSLEKVIKMLSAPKNLIWTYPIVALILNSIDQRDRAKALRLTTYKEVEALYQQDHNNVVAQAALVSRSFGSKGKWGNFTAVATARPNSALAYRLAAGDLSKTDSNAAITYYRRAIELDPRNGIQQREVAHMLLDIGNYAQAIKELEVFVKKYPYDSLGQYYLGWVYYRLDKDDLALQYYEKTLELNPKYENPYVYRSLCDIQTRRGLLDEALVNGRKAIDFSTEQNYSAAHKGFAHSLYAWALFKKGRQKEAENECKVALIISNDTDLGAHQCLGEIYLAQGKTAEARAEWEKVLTSIKNNPPTLERSYYYRDQATAMLEKHPAP